MERLFLTLSTGTKPFDYSLSQFTKLVSVVTLTYRATIGPQLRKKIIITIIWQLASPDVSSGLLILPNYVEECDLILYTLRHWKSASKITANLGSCHPCYSTEPRRVFCNEYREGSDHIQSHSQCIYIFCSLIHRPSRDIKKHMKKKKKKKEKKKTLTHPFSH